MSATKLQSSHRVVFMADDLAASPAKMLGAFTTSAAFNSQKSAAMRRRLADSGYTSPAQRKDCCARCEFMEIRTRNPYCMRQRIFVHKMGVCSLHSPIK